jgi:prepilin-type N-terminal cleavage/methylation domain-containing protein/prepilin-type processing-associated H-X9-DG protein
MHTMLQRRIARGFTLVELLVVITIIGILIALLLPAVQAAREAARRAECSNHLKQLALACLNHEAVLHYLPTGGWGSSWNGDPRYGTDWKQPGGWLFNLLPFVEQQSLHDQRLGKTLNSAEDTAACTRMTATPLSFLNCPSRRAAVVLASNMAQTDYAGNGGEKFLYFNKQDPSAGMAGPADYAAGTQNPGKAGWIDATNPPTGIFYGASQTTMADIKDGTSNTYLCAEKYVNATCYTTGTGDAGDDQSLYTGTQDDVCRWVNWVSSDATLTPAPMQDQPDKTNVYVFGSAHSGGFNAAMCDGSVRMINYTVDLETHRRLGNRSDGKPIEQN